jgi:repressor LexA
MMGLTQRQADCLRVIRETSIDGVSPTFDDIAKALGISSKSGVSRLVDALVERGYLRRLANRRQTLMLVADGLTGDTESVLAFLGRRLGRSRDQLVAQAIDEFIERQVRS